MHAAFYEPQWCFYRVSVINDACYIEDVRWRRDQAQLQLHPLLFLNMTTIFQKMMHLKKQSPGKTTVKYKIWNGWSLSLVNTTVCTDFTSSRQLVTTGMPPWTLQVSHCVGLWTHSGSDWSSFWVCQSKLAWKWLKPASFLMATWGRYLQKCTGKQASAQNPA